MAIVYDYENPCRFNEFTTFFVYQGNTNNIYLKIRREEEYVDNLNQK